MAGRTGEVADATLSQMRRLGAGDTATNFGCLPRMFPQQPRKNLANLDPCRRSRHADQPKGGRPGYRLPPLTVRTHVPHETANLGSTMASLELRVGEFSMALLPAAPARLSFPRGGIVAKCVRGLGGWGVPEDAKRPKGAERDSVWRKAGKK